MIIFIKDHLGNVRMVLTEQQEPVCYLAATVEDNSWEVANRVYYVKDFRRVAKTIAGNLPKRVSVISHIAPTED